MIFPALLFVPTNSTLFRLLAICETKFSADSRAGTVFSRLMMWMSFLAQRCNPAFWDSNTASGDQSVRLLLAGRAC